MSGVNASGPTPGDSLENMDMSVSALDHLHESSIKAARAEKRREGGDELLLVVVGVR